MNDGIVTHTFAHATMPVVTQRLPQGVEVSCERDSGSLVVTVTGAGAEDVPVVARGGFVYIGTASDISTTVHGNVGSVETHGDVHGGMSF